MQNCSKAFVSMRSPFDQTLDIFQITGHVDEIAFSECLISSLLFMGLYYFLFLHAIFLGNH